MHNPIAIAAKSKGILNMLARGIAISTRYGVSAGKMGAALSQLDKLLEEYSCRASLPVTASALSRQPVLVKKIHSQNHELAVHGLVHIDYSLLSFEQQREHLRKARLIFDAAGLRPTGFRCPYLRWNKETILALQDAAFDYDSSQALAWDAGHPKNEAYKRVLDFYGAMDAAHYPSLPRLEDGFMRIPYCLPDDEALVERFKLTPGPAMAEVWLGILDRIYAAGELFTLGLHPERAPLCKDALRAVLKKARSLDPPVWIARLDEIAVWQRGLGQARFSVSQECSDRYRISIEAPPRVDILIRSIEVEGDSRPWRRGYHILSEREFTFRSPRRPWIGLSPSSPAALRSFLEQQGYLVETSATSSNYSFFLQRDYFLQEDERPLLAELENADWPLIRIGRWPGGAKAALSVTGDVDAFTLWDYTWRLRCG